MESTLESQSLLWRSTVSWPSDKPASSPTTLEEEDDDTFDSSNENGTTTTTDDFVPPPLIQLSSSSPEQEPASHPVSPPVQDMSRLIHCGPDNGTTNNKNEEEDDPVFTVHSTFRDKRTGEKMLPSGLQWGLGGTSHVTYVQLSPDHGRTIPLATNQDDDNTSLDAVLTPRMRHALVEAHNRWAFAKHWPFRHVSDIHRIRRVGPSHVQVDWTELKQQRPPVMRRSTLRDVTTTDMIVELLEKEVQVLQEQQQDKEEGPLPVVQVWINGTFVSLLEGPDSLPRILDELQATTSQRLSYKKQDSKNGKVTMIRMERMFRGALRNSNVVLEHIMDNLLALEDIEILDDHTLIGTATLPDWIMGGQLTSRMWIQDTVGGGLAVHTDDDDDDDTAAAATRLSDGLNSGVVAFERPLYHDDISTSDRTFELRPDTAENVQKIAVVQHELARLRQLAQCTHPLVLERTTTTQQPQQPQAVENRRDQQHRRNRRKFFGW